jgi:hypothetical protein
MSSGESWAVIDHIDANGGFVNLPAYLLRLCVGYRP